MQIHSSLTHKEKGVFAPLFLWPNPVLILGLKKEKTCYKGPFNSSTVNPVVHAGLPWP